MATFSTEASGRHREVLNKSQCKDFCPLGGKKVAIVERWPLAEVQLLFQELINLWLPSFYPIPNPLPPGSPLLSLSPMGYEEEIADISDKLNPHAALHLEAAWLNG